MTPIERVSQRAFAFTILGVAASATKEDIRAAYRKLAFEKHPDRNPDAADEFARITAAYDFVIAHADALGVQSSPAANAPVKPRKVSRPTVKSSKTVFDAETLAECEELLAEQSEGGTQHIAVAVHRTGRNLTYLVPTDMQPGMNEVVVPTGMLVDSRHVMPKVIVFDALEANESRYQMDDKLCQAHFPGARSIELVFKA